MIARPRSVHGFRRSHWVITNINAVPGNIDQLRLFKRRLNRLWRNVMVRRSQRAQIPWERLTPVFDRWIPEPRILHPYPDVRFAATHPSWEPYA
jgi:hypothetical protein